MKINSIASAVVNESRWFWKFLLLLLHSSDFFFSQDFAVKTQTYLEKEKLGENLATLEKLQQKKINFFVPTWASFFSLQPQPHFSVRYLSFSPFFSSSYMHFSSPCSFVGESWRRLICIFFCVRLDLKSSNFPSRHFRFPLHAIVIKSCKWTIFIADEDFILQ